MKLLFLGEGQAGGEFVRRCRGVIAKLIAAKTRCGRSLRHGILGAFGERISMHTNEEHVFCHTRSGHC